MSSACKWAQTKEHLKLAWQDTDDPGRSSTKTLKTPTPETLLLLPSERQVSKDEETLTLTLSVRRNATRQFSRLNWTKTGTNQIMRTYENYNTHFMLSTLSLIETFIRASKAIRQNILHSTFTPIPVVLHVFHLIIKCALCYCWLFYKGFGFDLQPSTYPVVSLQWETWNLFERSNPSCSTFGLLYLSF